MNPIFGPPHTTLLRQTDCAADVGHPSSMDPGRKSVAAYERVLRVLYVWTGQIVRKSQPDMAVPRAAELQPPFVVQPPLAFPIQNIRVVAAQLVPAAIVPGPKDRR